MKRLLMVLAVLLGLGAQGQAQSSNPGPAIDCYIATTSTTSVTVTGCHAPEPGLAIYITDISVYGDIITAVTTPAQIQSGAAGTCTTPIVHWACQHPATNGCEAHFRTPIRATGTVCILDATVGTKWVSIKGFVAAK